MYNQNKYFSYFTKQQKSALCHSIKAYVKKNLDKDDLLNLFLESEKYYFEINSSRLHFIKDYLEDTTFLKEIKYYFNECRQYYEYQKKLEPMKQLQKEIAKEQRKKIIEFQMSKEVPTKKQLAYYKSLCKKYQIQQHNLENLSKLDLKNMIGDIKNEYKTN